MISTQSDRVSVAEVIQPRGHWEIQWNCDSRTCKQSFLPPLRLEHAEAVVLLAEDLLKTNSIRNPNHARAVWVNAGGMEVVSYILQKPS